mgnify:CR=1 FL=1
MNLSDFSTLILNHDWTVPDDAEPNVLKFLWSRGIGYRDCFMPKPSHEVIEARWERLGFGF